MDVDRTRTACREHGTAVARTKPRKNIHRFPRQEAPIRYLSNCADDLCHQGYSQVPCSASTSIALYAAFCRIRESATSWISSISNQSSVCSLETWRINARIRLSSVSLPVSNSQSIPSSLQLIDNCISHLLTGSSLDEHGVSRLSPWIGPDPFGFRPPAMMPEIGVAAPRSPDPADFSSRRIPSPENRLQ